VPSPLNFLMRTIAEINDKISRKQAIIWAVEELKARVAEVGVTQAAKEVDVITTGTFEPMVVRWGVGLLWIWSS
jgi:L-aspartate semialdehyde sulfurtransferase